MADFDQRRHPAGADGKELFYLTLDHTLMAVPVRAAAGFQAGAVEPLFQARPAEYCQGCCNDYAASHEGRKFLVNTRLGVAGSQGIQVMVGGQPLLGSGRRPGGICRRAFKQPSSQSYMPKTHVLSTDKWPDNETCSVVRAGRSR